MSMQYIFHVNEANFQYEVIAFSQNTPVVVDFWAPWCRPCRVMSPMLERLVMEAKGSFRLAKVDVDENPNLALFYNVRTVPTIKAISRGAVIFEYAGVIPEQKIREMMFHLSKINKENLKLERANSFLLDHQWKEAESGFREFLKGDPNQPEALLGLVKTLIMQGEYRSARKILDDFPTSRLSTVAEMLQGFIRNLQLFKEDALPGSSDLDITFNTALRLVIAGNIPAALDALLDILKQDRNYQEGRARFAFLSIIEIMGSDEPDMRSYRQELANILF